MPRSLKIVVGILFILRVALSFTLSDGRFKGDSIAYFGAVVNLGLNGSVASIQPADEKRFAGGADPGELYDHLAGLTDPMFQLLPFQWLHAALYGPILFFWRSLTPVILINNMLFFGAGMLFFRAAARQASAAALGVGWIVFAFFPPFYYLTSNFVTEPLFMFLLAAVVLLIDKLGREQFFLLFLCATALSLTRPFGLAVVAAFALYSVYRSHYARAAGVACAAVLAFVINLIVMHNAVPDHARTYAVSTAEMLYRTNTAEGNGDFAYYAAVPQAAAADSALQRYRSGSMRGAALLFEALKQNLRAPRTFVKNSLMKLTNYFFSVVPPEWTYPPASPQTPRKKYLWVLQNLVLFLLAGAGMAKAPRHASQIFGFVFAAALVFYFVLLARYRYFLPVLAYAAAFVPLAADRLRPRLQRISQELTR